MNTRKDNSARLQIYQSAVQAYRSRDYARAETLLQSLVMRTPRFAEAHHLLGICYYVKANLIDAERSIRTALSFAKHADFHVNLGLVLQQAGDEDGAAESYRAALRLNPNLPKACNNLANILTGQKQLEAAVDLYRQAIALQPNYPIGHKNLGSCLVRLKRFDEAEVALRHAIALDESFAESKLVLANMLVQKERFGEAFELYRSIGAWGKLQFEMRTIADWTEIARIDEACLHQLSATKIATCAPWGLLQMPGVTRALQKQAAHEFAIKELAELKSPPMCRLDRHPGERLRIGYLSSDFYEHATMHLLAGVLENHDRASFDINIFSYAPRREDAFTNRLRASAMPIIDIANVSDQAAAREIADRQIDILVDLKGYTTSARLGISALRPAPIIVNWLGYPGTLGHKRLADYIIGDAVVTPPEDANSYSERLALMPNSYQPNDRLRPLPQPPSRGETGLPDEGLVFCCFNQLLKFNPQAFDIWAHLLSAVPGSVLWLLQPKSQVALSNVVREMKTRGVAADRVIFAPFVSREKHLARLQHADLALDTFPCNSHTTASDALWTGVPLITLVGETFASRVAASLLTSHGFPELIATTGEGYFELAYDLAVNEQKRAGFRERLQRARDISPLFDTVGFTKDLEALYRAMVIDHRTPEEQRPNAVTIAQAQAATIDTATDQTLRAAFDHYRQGELDQAAGITQALLSRLPQLADAHHLLGLCHARKGNLKEAEGAIRKALTYAEHPDFYLNLAVILGKTGTLDDAANAYRASIRLNPKGARAYNNLGNIFCVKHRYDEAAEMFRKAVIAQPDYALGYKNLGDALVQTGQLKEAFDAYRKVGAWGDLQFAMRMDVSWKHLAEVDLAYIEDLAAGKSSPTHPWRLLSIQGMTPELEKRASRTFANSIFAELQTTPLTNTGAADASNRPLRIGYLSSDFHNHPTMHLLAGVFEAHDRQRFEVSAFSYGSEHDDEFTQRLRATRTDLTDISQLSDYDAARLIFERQIDILVDLKGYTTGGRQGITALRPSPIIASWLGYPGTLGHEQLADYIVGDMIVTPPEDVAHYSERLALMPHSYQPNDEKRPLPDRPTRARAGLPDTGLVFCSFNQALKFTPKAFDIWARLLRHIPESVLWLLTPALESARTNILEEFRTREIPSDRLIFARPLSQADHMARLRLADIALDTFPCNSHTTGSDALWAGVPLVTMKGRTFASRVAESLVTAHGFPELVAENADEYFSLALELATNEQRRVELKERLNRARSTSPLFDTALFTRDLERLYLAMVENHSRPEPQRLRVITAN